MPERDGISRNIRLLFVNVKGAKTWWQTRYAEEHGTGTPKSDTEWHIRAIAALNSCTWNEEAISCSVGLVANLIRRKSLPQGGSVDQVIGAPQKVFTADGRICSPVAVSVFLSKCEQIVRSHTRLNATIYMCASGVEYLFDTQEHMQVALFMTEHPELFLACGTGSLNDVKVSRFALEDGLWGDNACGTVLVLDSGYSISVEHVSEGDEKDVRPNDCIKILIHGPRDSKTLIVSQKNMKTFYDYLKTRRQNLKWEADRTTFDCSMVLF